MECSAEERQGSDLAEAGARARRARCFSEAAELLPDLVQPALALCALRSLAVPDALEVLDLQWQCKGGNQCSERGRRQGASNTEQHPMIPAYPAWEPPSGKITHVLPSDFKHLRTTSSPSSSPSSPRPC